MLKPPTIGLRAGLFPFGETRVAVDKWYLCAPCPKCQATVAVLETLEGVNPAAGSGKPPEQTWATICPECGEHFSPKLVSLQNIQAVQVH